MSEGEEAAEGRGSMARAACCLKPSPDDASLVHAEHAGAPPGATIGSRVGRGLRTGRGSIPDADPEEGGDAHGQNTLKGTGRRCVNVSPWRCRTAGAGFAGPRSPTAGLPRKEAPLKTPCVRDPEIREVKAIHT